MKDLDLAFSYVPRAQRLLLGDLFALDAALGQVVRTTTEPMLGRIRLAWWRERLEELDQGLVPAEPTLEAAARLINETGLTGAMLAGLVEGWEPLLSEFPWTEEVAGPVAARGALLFGFAALLLGAAPPGVKMSQTAGALWAQVDVAKHCSDEQSRSVLIDVAKTLLDQWSGGPVEPAVRPLTMSGLLARRDLERWPDLEPEATPVRAWMMIRHRLTGRL